MSVWQVAKGKRTKTSQRRIRSAINESWPRTAVLAAPPQPSVRVVRPADALRRCDELMKTPSMMLEAVVLLIAAAATEATGNDEGIDVSNIMPEGSRRRVSRHSYVEDDANGSDQDGRKHDDY